VLVAGDVELDPRLARAARATVEELADEVCFLSRVCDRADGQAICVERVGSVQATRGPSAGLGEDLRLRGRGVVGSGLELGDELIQLSAFTSEGGRMLRPARIARPTARG